MKLEDIRKNIDETDRELFKLFEKRMALAKEVALSKIETGDKIYKPEREDVVIDKFSSAAPDDMKQYYKSFIKRVMLISREYQYKIISENKEGSFENRTVQVTFESDYWPDAIITAIADSGAQITDIHKEEDAYTLNIICSNDNEKMKALLSFIENESR